jgi:Uma2 family endonuclease
MPSPAKETTPSAPTALPPLHRRGIRYTYDDYLTWDDGQRYELIDGDAYALAAPSRLHQDVVLELGKQLSIYLEGKKCRVYIAPFDVKLSDDIVVQPDVAVICDKTKYTDAGCTGAPDMIIEVLSPATASYDAIVKFNKYMTCGVGEYWLVDIQNRVVMVYLFRDGVTLANVYEFAADIPVATLAGCRLNLRAIISLMDE